MRKAKPMKDSPKRADFKEVEPATIIFNEKRKPVKAHVANHPTFGLAGGKFCTGPPGRSRSPGIVDILFPDHPPDNKADPDTSPLSACREGQGVSQK